MIRLTVMGTDWLRIWSYLALFTGILTAVALYAGGLTFYNFSNIPFGMGWWLAASVVLHKRSKRTSFESEEICGKQTYYVA